MSCTATDVRGWTLEKTLRDTEESITERYRAQKAWTPKG